MTREAGISDKWIKASVIGATWAASEILLGSFLHNLRIPFSSNLLTAIGIVILVSSSYKWTEKGLFWRAGLICALMKTMSPSAVIFGPMIAIISEAALLEISVRIFGRTIPGFLIGSMLAMSWNLFHKIMNFIIFYGTDIVGIYSNLLKYAEKQLNTRIDLVWSPILVLLFLFCIMGAVSAFIGIRAGRKIVTQPADYRLKRNQEGMSGQKDHGQSFDYSVAWLLFDLALVVTSFLLLNFTSWFIWSPAISIIAFLWIIRYKRALRQLSRPSFWLYFVIITMLTAFVINKIQSQDFANGMLAGIQMNFRAIVVILGFSVLGTELYNPKIREFFMRTSFRQLPMAMELAFESLPIMIAAIPDTKTIIRQPVSIIYQIISQIDFRLDEIKRNLSKKIYIVTGKVGQGKTTQAQKIAEKLKAQNIGVNGILSPRIVENGTTTGYDIVNIATGERAKFLRRSENQGYDKIGSYSILPDGLETGICALAISKESDRMITVIDEVGKLELENRGWAANLNELIFGSDHYLVITVRDTFVEDVIRKWGFRDYYLFTVSENTSAEVVELITRHNN